MFDLVSEYAVDGTSLLVQNGFVSGINSNTLNPQGNANATRAQAATLLAKLLEN